MHKSWVEDRAFRVVHNTFENYYIVNILLQIFELFLYQFSLAEKNYYITYLGRKKLGQSISRPNCKQEMWAGQFYSHGVYTIFHHTPGRFSVRSESGTFGQGMEKKLI